MEFTPSPVGCVIASTNGIFYLLRERRARDRSALVDERATER
jgi:hypothetical protein